MREGEDRLPEEKLADLVADRILVLAGRLDEAREVGLGALVEAVLAAEPGSGPVVRDADLLRELLSRIDAALAQIEARTAELEPGRSRGRR